MGLDISHGTWNGSYTSFGEWRRWVASLEGVEIDSKGALPTHYLLNHSDTEGKIVWEKLNSLADRLQFLLDNSEQEDGTTDFDYKWLCKKTKKFISGCREAYNLKESLVFS